MELCQVEAVYKYVLGGLLCIGAVISYFPQCHSLVKTKQHQGISELSLFVLGLGSVTLVYNTVVLNWGKFLCYNQCNFWVCTANLMSVYQIMVGWVMVFPLYLIFIRYKIKNSERKWIYDIGYIFTYIVLVLVIIIVGLSEKMVLANSSNFFTISAWIAGGIVSPICSCIVWIPQIIKLVKTREQGSLSLAMFLIQTPGNGIIIAFQIFYGQNWTTWISYLVTLVEQLVIVIMLLCFKYNRTVEIFDIPEVLDSNLDEADLSDVNELGESDLGEAEILYNIV